MTKTPMLLLLTAVTSLLLCMSTPSDLLIWLTLSLFAAFGCSVLWTLIQKVRK